MIGLSDSQLEIVMENAEALAEDKCQDFLERVAAVLQERGQINDDEVSAAVQLALRDLIHNSAVWKEWRRNSLASHEDGQEFDSRPSGAPVALTTRRAWRLFPAWCMNLRLKLSARRQPAQFHPIVHTWR
jgi:hypothetical protein